MTLQPRHLQALDVLTSGRTSKSPREGLSSLESEDPSLATARSAAFTEQHPTRTGHLKAPAGRAGGPSSTAPSSGPSEQYRTRNPMELGTGRVDQTANITQQHSQSSGEEAGGKWPDERTGREPRPSTSGRKSPSPDSDDSSITVKPEKPYSTRRSTVPSGRSGSNSSAAVRRGGPSSRS